PKDSARECVRLKPDSQRVNAFAPFGQPAAQPISSDELPVSLTGEPKAQLEIEAGRAPLLHQERRVRADRDPFPFRLGCRERTVHSLAKRLVDPGTVDTTRHKRDRRVL